MLSSETAEKFKERRDETNSAKSKEAKFKSKVTVERKSRHFIGFVEAIFNSKMQAQNGCKKTDKKRRETGGNKVYSSAQ